MREASPFLQHLVRAYAYIDFCRTVAQYLREAGILHEQKLLLFEGYAICRDRWPTSNYSAAQVLRFFDLMMMKLNFYKFYDLVREESCSVRPVHLGPFRHWREEVNIELDRRNRVSPHF